MELNWRFLLVVVISLLSTVTQARVITIQNKCDTTIWPAFQVLGAHRETDFVANGLELGPGQSTHLTTPSFWILYIWGRSGCSFDSSGNGTCISGNCGGKLRCAVGVLPDLPVTLVTVGVSNDIGIYGVNLDTGFNIPVSVSASGPGSENCKSSSCTADINGICPIELQVRVNDRVVACKTACMAYKKPEYCCSDLSDKKKCKATNYINLFKKKCPTATTNASDPRMFTCIGTDILVSFC